MTYLTTPAGRSTFAALLLSLIGLGAILTPAAACPAKPHLHPATIACMEAEHSTLGGSRLDLGTYTTHVRAPHLRQTLRRERRATQVLSHVRDDHQLHKTLPTVQHQWGVLVRLCEGHGVEINTSGYRLW